MLNKQDKSQLVENESTVERAAWVKPAVRKMRAGDAENFTRDTRADGPLSRS